LHVKCVIVRTLCGQAKFPQDPPEYLRLYRTVLFTVQNQQ